MNINPISFQGITKITGNRPIASADRISRMIRYNEKGYTKAESEIAELFDIKETKGLAASETFDNGKTAYVVTGEECEQLEVLRRDLAQRCDLASQVYEKRSNIAKLIMDAEYDRYIDLAKMLIVCEEDSALNVQHDDINGITSFDVIM